MEINDDEILEKIRKNFRELRKEKGLTQIEVASKTGYSEQMIVKMETKGANIKLTSLVKYANVFNMSPAELAERLLK